MNHLTRIAGILIASLVVLAISVLVFYYAQGYRINVGTQSLDSTSILVANSFPSDADIFLDGKREGVTQKSLYLKPNQYDVRIQKEGYTMWSKTYHIKPEGVYRTDALMFSLNPSLSPLTNRGVIAPALSSQRNFIVYVKEPDDTTLVTVPGEEEKSGIFKAPLTSSALTLFQRTDLLLPFSQFPQTDFLDKTTFSFSPDEKQLMVFFRDGEEAITFVYLIPLGNPMSYLDVTQSYETILERWDKQENENTDALIDTTPKKIRETLREHTRLMSLSPDKERILYYATSEATLTIVISPPLNSPSPTKEERNLKANTFYVYDSKHDKNYRLPVFEDETKNGARLENLVDRIFWYGDSKHIVTVLEDTMNIIDYDGTNNVLVYSGPFEKDLYGATSDGKLVIVTNLNPKRSTYSDLYAISIK